MFRIATAQVDQFSSVLQIISKHFDQKNVPYFERSWKICFSFSATLLSPLTETVSCATYGKQKERNLPSKSKKNKTLKLVTCNFIFCNLRCLSLLISRSALNFEHARTCSLALFSDGAHIPYMIMTSNDIILSWTLCLRITHTKHFRLYSHMT